jgi:hypothetical protein
MCVCVCLCVKLVSLSCGALPGRRFSTHQHMISLVHAPCPINVYHCISIQITMICIHTYIHTLLIYTNTYNTHHAASNIAQMYSQPHPTRHRRHGSHSQPYHTHTHTLIHTPRPNTLNVGFGQRVGLIYTYIRSLLPLFLGEPLNGPW